MFTGNLQFGIFAVILKITGKTSNVVIRHIRILFRYTTMGTVDRYYAHSIHWDVYVSLRPIG